MRRLFRSIVLIAGCLLASSSLSPTPAKRGGPCPLMIYDATIDTLAPEGPTVEFLMKNQSGRKIHGVKVRVGFLDAVGQPVRSGKDGSGRLAEAFAVELPADWVLTITDQEVWRSIWPECPCDVDGVTIEVLRVLFDDGSTWLPSGKNGGVRRFMPIVLRPLKGLRLAVITDAP